MIFNLIDKIYSYSHFTTLLVGAIAFLIVLFIIVLYMGIKDAKKSKEPVIEKEEKEKDITFEELTEEQKEVAEDVTFEMPSITKDLEDFKKGVEEELKNTPAPPQVEETENLEEEPVVEETSNDFTSVEDVFKDDGVEDDFLSLIRDKDETPVVSDIEVHEEDIPMSLEEIDSNKHNVIHEAREINDNTMEIELPAKHEEVKPVINEEIRPFRNEVQPSSFNSEERRKKERMLDDYLTQTQALSLDAINEKLKEFENDDF